MSEANRLPHLIPDPSLYDLMQHLTKMTTPLERVWSEGLETESARSARAEAKQVWQSFNITFKRWTEYAFSLREQAGLEPVIIEEFRVQDTGLGRLSFDPDTPEQRYYQLQIAAMYAFQDLHEIYRPWTTPTHENSGYPRALWKRGEMPVRLHSLGGVPDPWQGY